MHYLTTIILIHEKTGNIFIFISQLFVVPKFVNSSCNSLNIVAVIPIGLCTESYLLFSLLYTFCRSTYDDKMLFGPYIISIYT